MLMTSALVFMLAQAVTPPSPTPPPPFRGPIVVLETSLGTIKLGLYPDKTPITVKNFLGYVEKKHYDGTIFHRVIANFMIQGGGFDASMKQRPTDPPIKNEAKGAPSNRRGTVAMARTDDPNSATAQFFINVKDNLGLDFGVQGAGYTVFGEVLAGMDVVDRIKLVPTSGGDVPTTQVVIKTARVVGAKTEVVPVSKPATSNAPAPKPSARP